MRSPLEVIRHAVESFAEARARALRAPDDAERARDAALARRALGRGHAREVLADAVGMRLLDDAEHAALLSWLALAARDEVLARAAVLPLGAHETAVHEGMPRTLAELVSLAYRERTPESRGRAVQTVADVVLARRQQATDVSAECDERAATISARGPRAADATPEDLAASASSFLARTDDLARELFERLAHAAGQAPRTVPELLVVLRAPSLEPLVTPAARARRLSSTLSALGLSDALAQRARLDGPHSALALDAEVLELAPPHAVVIRPSPLELGLASELAMMRGIGRALAATLVAPALPPALRRSVEGSVPHALGELWAHLHADPIFLARLRGTSGSAARALGGAVLGQTLLRTRALAARELADGEGPGDAERGAELLARAFAVRDASMPRALALPDPLDRSARRASLRAALFAPALFVALREQFGEDFFRNPRAAEPLRAAAARGAQLSVEAWAGELGASLDASPGRLAELLR